MLLFIGWAGILLVEGFCVAALITRNDSRWLLLSLALPSAALSNVLIFFINTIFHLPLSPSILLLEHTLVTVAVFIVNTRSTPITVQPSIKAITLNNKFIRLICSVVLLLNVAFSFAHMVLLPTYQIDSLTNWTMRSKISFYDHAIAFDTDELRGMSKPQYPFLVHALQIVVNEGNPEWNDRSANAILWFFSLSSFASLFLLLKRLRGTDIALLAVTLIITTPLLGYHLAVPYGDIHLVTMLLLSLAVLLLFLKEKNQRWLLLSAFFLAASVWTKSEGLIVGLLPWAIVISLLAFKKYSMSHLLAHRSLGVVVAISPGWPLFVLIRGLRLTPHETDVTIAFHPEGVVPAVSGLFAGGSFGVTWFCLLVAFSVLCVLAHRKDPRVDRTILLTSLLGFAALAIVLFTYLFTPNVAFLLSGQSYYRPLMVPASLLLLSCIAAWRPEKH